MGATVITGIRIAAIPQKGSEQLFLLFEETYEKNCYPHTPSWGCRAIGNYAAIVDAIFRNAAAYEDGILQSRGGQGTTEGFIDRCMKALIAPLQAHNSIIEIEVGNGYGAAVPEKHESFAIETLRGIGRDDIATRLASREAAKVSLFDDVDVVVALYGRDSPIPPWRAISIHNCGSAPYGQKIEVPKGPQAQMPECRFYKLGQFQIIGHFGMEPIRKLGSNSLAVQKFICEVAYPAQLTAPGSYRTLIPQGRDLINGAIECPREAVATIDLQAIEGEGYAHSFASKFAVKLGRAQSVDQVPVSFDLTLGEALDKGLLNDLEQISADAVTWHVPECGAQAPQAQCQMALSI